MTPRVGIVVAAFALVLSSCGDDVDTTCFAECGAPDATILMDFSDGAGFFDAPFPSDDRRDARGRPDLTGFPNPQKIVLVDRVLDVLKADADGFGQSSGIFFRVSARLDPSSLPSMEESVKPGASVALYSVDPDAPDYLQAYPVAARYVEDPGLYGPPNLLSVVPLQGAPMRPRTRYAVIVRTSVTDETSRPLGRSPAMAALANGEVPDGMSADVAASYFSAIHSLDAIAPPNTIAAMTVFTTGDATETMETAIARAFEDGIPEANEAFAKTDDFPTFCVYQATVDMPVYQSGEPPYLEVGGNWVLDETGAPLLDHVETAKFVVTIPKSEMPENGYPIVVFSRTGGGGDRPLVDRGLRARNGGPAIEPGTGPALEMASVGYAGASVDGPHGGSRNVSGGDEQFLVFNFQNPLALRDNVRQSALELALMPEILAGVTIDVSDCAGAVAPDGARFDLGTAAIMGHSMGAAIAPLALVYEPRYRAVLLSGAGGSFLANMIHKQKPLAVKPLAELILGLTVAGYSLTEYDPFISLLQWAGEPADNPLYGRHVVREPIIGGPRHVLMMQGIVDHYIMPPIANATSLSFGLDLAGDALDEDTEELADLAALGDLLVHSGGKKIALPASNNAASGSGDEVTAVVTQTREDGIEDGHEVVFQTEGPKHAYACFLASLAEGAPKVPAPGQVGDACE